MSTPEERERESEESSETRYDEEVERESEERAEEAREIGDVPPPREDSDAD